MQHTVWRAASAVVLVALSLSSAPKKPYNSHEKAFYLDPAVVQYVNPGLTITINSAAVAKDGTISVVYTIADPTGQALDASGGTTPGAVTLGFIASVLPNNQSDYVTYTTRAASGTAVPSTNQPSTDSGGTSTQTGPGQYQYVLHTHAPSGFD